MSVRTALVALVVLATIGFVVGTSIERHNAGHESAAHVRSEGAASATSDASGEGGETDAEHAAETGATSSAKPSGAAGDAHQELRPLGIDIEAIPFVILASLVSLSLTAGAWSRPRWIGLLATLGLAMIVFGALDIREVFHQNDESQTGLAVLAGVIGSLHLAAAAIAGRMARAATMQA